MYSLSEEEMISSESGNNPDRIVEANIHAKGISVAGCSVDSVSLDGVLIAGGHGLTEGVTCDVTLSIHGTTPVVKIGAKGLVIRVRPDRCAIQFREIDGDNYELLRDLVRTQLENT